MTRTYQDLRSPEYLARRLSGAEKLIAALKAEVAACLGHKTKIALTLKVAELEDWVKHVQNEHADECSTCNDRARTYFAQSNSQVKE